MGLREDALAAAEAAAADEAAAAAAAAAAREATARATLASVLSPTQVDGLEVVAALSVRLVFCGDGICLAVRDADQRVSLVTDSQGWTWLGDVTSLAELGRLLGGA